jgi:hypothetical protein
VIERLNFALAVAVCTLVIVLLGGRALSRSFLFPVDKVPTRAVPDDVTAMLSLPATERRCVSWSYPGHRTRERSSISTTTAKPRSLESTWLAQSTRSRVRTGCLMKLGIES